MSFLDELNLEDVDGSEIDYSIPNGTYPCMINKSELVDNNKKPGKQQWQITYKVSDDYDPTDADTDNPVNVAGRTVSEWFDLDPELPANRKAWLKRRLISLGIDDDATAHLEPEDIIGIEVYVTVINKRVGENTYVNVKKVQLADGSISTTGAVNEDLFGGLY